jgi:hypothetical protein
MTLSAAPGTNERATRFAPVAPVAPSGTSVSTPVGSVDGAQPGGLIRRLDTGNAGGTGLLLIVGLLLGLILISAGCGPPS